MLQIDREKSTLKGKLTKKNVAHTLITEIAWETCNQVGGIYSVLRSKVPTMINKFKQNYCLIGPYIQENAANEFEETTDSSAFCKVVTIMQQNGLEVYYGKWLVPGRPNIVLLNPYSVNSKLNDIKYHLWQNHHIGTGDDDLINGVVGFGYLTNIFLETLVHKKSKKFKLIAHFHEWMAATPIPELRRNNVNLAITFTTHATLLGRYLAMNDDNFYTNLESYNWLDEAKRFYIEPQVRIERAAAHGAHVFTTVSEVTAVECKHLIGRKPDIVTPNGINIERFHVLHEFQNIHQQCKEHIHRFTMSHFFNNYTFDLDNTLYF
ncbi:MAG: glycogen synthase, partial [Candidatus Heimdallarchaeota archaeon]